MSKILVTGSAGLLGSAFRTIESDFPDHDFYFATRDDGDLTNAEQVSSLYQSVYPKYVIHTAAKVGGIGLNRSRPAELFYENILMNSHMIHYAYKSGVEKIVCYSSVCTFPDDAKVLKEDLQQCGKPFGDNFAYGYAKRMVDIQIKAYRQQYGVNYCSVIPTNLYGPNDNFSLTHGHVIASLAHKCYLAKRDKSPLVIWGDGSPLREFIYSEDVARLTMAMLKIEEHDKVIISNNSEISIKDTCQLICKCMDFDGDIIFDTSKPNGQHRRPSDISRLMNIVPDLKFTNHNDGITRTVKWFVDNYPNVRT